MVASNNHTLHLYFYVTIRWYDYQVSLFLNTTFYANLTDKQRELSTSILCLKKLFILTFYYSYLHHYRNHFIKNCFINELDIMTTSRENNSLCALQRCCIKLFGVGGKQCWLEAANWVNFFDIISVYSLKSQVKTFPSKKLHSLDIYFLQTSFISLYI